MSKIVKLSEVPWDRGAVGATATRSPTDQPIASASWTSSKTSSPIDAGVARSDHVRARSRPRISRRGLPPAATLPTARVRRTAWVAPLFLT